MRAIDADALMAKLGIGQDCSICKHDDTPYCCWKPDVVDVCEAICDAHTIEPEPHWIPCEERMPELNVYVIATTQWYEITMACRIGDGEWFINEGDSNAYDDDVIAWMPLPEPYREGES